MVDDVIKSNIKPEQNTLILRDLSTSKTTEEIFKIFSDLKLSNGAACPVVQSARADIENTWFVTFSNESDARSAWQAIRSVVIDGRKVSARLKTESTAKYRITPNAYLSTRGSNDVNSPSSANTSLANTPQQQGGSVFFNNSTQGNNSQILYNQGVYTEPVPPIGNGTNSVPGNNNSQIIYSNQGSSGMVLGQAQMPYLQQSGYHPNVATNPQNIYVNNYPQQQQQSQGQNNNAMSPRTNNYQNAMNNKSGQFNNTQRNSRYNNKDNSYVNRNNSSNNLNNAGTGNTNGNVTSAPSPRFQDRGSYRNNKSFNPHNQSSVTTPQESNDINTNSISVSGGNTSNSSSSGNNLQNNVSANSSGFSSTSNNNTESRIDGRSQYQNRDGGYNNNNRFRYSNQNNASMNQLLNNNPGNVSNISDNSPINIGMPNVGVPMPQYFYPNGLVYDFQGNNYINNSYIDQATAMNMSIVAAQQQGVVNVVPGNPSHQQQQMIIHHQQQMQQQPAFHTSLQQVVYAANGQFMMMSMQPPNTIPIPNPGPPPKLSKNVDDKIEGHLRNDTSQGNANKPISNSGVDISLATDSSDQEDGRRDYIYFAVSSKSINNSTSKINIDESQDSADSPGNNASNESEVIPPKSLQTLPVAMGKDELSKAVAVSTGPPIISSDEIPVVVNNSPIPITSPVIKPIPVPVPVQLSAAGISIPLPIHIHPGTVDTCCFLLLKYYLLDLLLFFLGGMQNTIPTPGSPSYPGIQYQLPYNPATMTPMSNLPAGGIVGPAGFHASYIGGTQYPYSPQQPGMPMQQQYQGTEIDLYKQQIYRTDLVHICSYSRSISSTHEFGLFAKSQ